MTVLRLSVFGWSHRLTALLFLLLLVAGGRFGLGWIQGSVTATTVLETVPLADPLAALEVTAASWELEPTLLLGALLLALAAVLIGPVFCGWVCPLGLLLDLNAALRRAVLRLVTRKPQRRPFARESSGLKYALLGFVLVFSLVAGFPLFQTISPINALVWAAVFVVSPALLLVAGLVVLEWFAPRFWCRSLCPQGALYSMLGRCGLLRVRINPATAGREPCRQCTINCPMGIRVMEEFSLKQKRSVDHPDCTRCGACVDVCNGGVLSLGFRNIRPGLLTGCAPSPTEASAQESAESLAGSSRSERRSPPTV